MTAHYEHRSVLALGWTPYGHTKNLSMLAIGLFEACSKTGITEVTGGFLNRRKTVSPSRLSKTG